MRSGTTANCCNNLEIQEENPPFHGLIKLIREGEWRVKDFGEG